MHQYVCLIHFFRGLVRVFRSRFGMSERDRKKERIFNLMYTFIQEIPIMGLGQKLSGSFIYWQNYTFNIFYIYSENKKILSAAWIIKNHSVVWLCFNAYFPGIFWINALRFGPFLERIMNRYRCGSN